MSASLPVPTTPAPRVGRGHHGRGRGGLRWNLYSIWTEVMVGGSSALAFLAELMYGYYVEHEFTSVMATEMHVCAHTTNRLYRPGSSSFSRLKSTVERIYNITTPCIIIIYLSSLYGAYITTLGWEGAKSGKGEDYCQRGKGWGALLTIHQ